MSKSDPKSQQNSKDTFPGYELTFSKQQRTFLILSAIIPVTIFLLQVANIIFIILNPPPGSPHEFIFLRFLNTSTPVIVMIIMSLFGIFNFIFLLSWRKKVGQYNMQKQSFTEMISNQSSDDTKTDYISFTHLAYKNLKHMKRMRIFLFISSIISILYIWWSIRGLLVGLGIIIPVEPVNPPFLALNILNICAQIVLIAYFIYQWAFFFKWNKRVVKIEHYERQIIEELDL